MEMRYHGLGLQTALADFRDARRRAAMQEIMARLTGKSARLLSYEEVHRKLRAAGRTERGLQSIPLEAIVGSVGRCSDFNRSFLPRQDSDEQRWARVKALAADANAKGLPPIDVYQIGEAYFVLDGHHRVSVARQLGMTHIPAHVIEVRTKVPLTPDVQPDDLIVKAEYAEFLEATRLDQIRPQADLSVSVPGQYAKLENHIEVHRYFAEEALGQEVPYGEAVAQWYDQAYLPVVQVIRERGILRDFPDRTEADLYLWIAEHGLALEEEMGWKVRPEVAATDLSAQFSPRRRINRVGRRLLNAVLPASLVDGPAPGQWREEKLTARYSDRLFADLLVPVSGEAAGWLALDQALIIARREQAAVHGLHVVAHENQKESAAALSVREAFARRCQAAGVAGQLSVEVGEVARAICERAVVTDLVCLTLAHPPDARPRARLGSGLRTIIRRCARPVLAVPADASMPDAVLLAYDGSPKAKEALFVAAYLGEQWKASLTVVTVIEVGRTNAETQDHARAYLEMHEIQADYLRAGGHVAEVVLQVAAERSCGLIAMGGYGHSPLVEVVVGSSVDAVLRAAQVPVLICR